MKIGPRQRIWEWKGLGASESGSGDRIFCSGDVKPTDLSGVGPLG